MYGSKARALFDTEQNRSGLDIISGLKIDLDDPAGVRRLYLVLHFHSLEDEDRLSLLDFVSSGFEHLDDASRHGGFHISPSLPGFFLPKDLQCRSFFNPENPTVDKDRMGQGIGVDDDVKDSAVDVEKDFLPADEFGGDIISLAIDRYPEASVCGHIQTDARFLLSDPEEIVHPRAYW